MLTMRLISIRRRQDPVVLHDSESDFGAAFGRLPARKIAGAANDDLVIA